MRLLVTKAGLNTADCDGRCFVSVLQASVREQKKLLVENGKLKKDIEQLRIQLQEKQKRRTGKKAAEPPNSSESRQRLEA